MLVGQQLSETYCTVAPCCGGMLPKSKLSTYISDFFHLRGSRHFFISTFNYKLFRGVMRNHDVQQGHRHVAWTRTCTVDLGMQYRYGHTVHAPWTWICSMVMGLDMLHGHKHEVET